MIVNCFQLQQRLSLSVVAMAGVVGTVLGTIVSRTLSGVTGCRIVRIMKMNRDVAVSCVAVMIQSFPTDRSGQIVNCLSATTISSPIFNRYDQDCQNNEDEHGCGGKLFMSWQT